MADVSYLTLDGLNRLKDELARMKGPEREEIAKRLRAAIDQGDLSENADYTSAKEDQAFLEGRIQETERLLSNVVIIDNVTKNLEEVGIGDHITIQEGAYQAEKYHLVGPKEADPGNGRISLESPIGKALLGRKVGEEVMADTPGGSIRFKILKIE
ncbi:MAG: transcription elongation factor GreA [Bellilinea sp.]